MKLSVLMVLAAVTGGVDEPALTCDQRLMILHENSVRLATRSFLFGHACARVESLSRSARSNSSLRRAAYRENPLLQEDKTVLALEIIGALVIAVLIGLGVTKYLERRNHQLN